MQPLHSFVVALLWSLFADAQTLTVVNGAGATVVEVVTTNAAGNPTTQIIQTIASSASLNSLTASTTGTNPSTTLSTTQLVGPVVGQPGTTPVTPGGPTPYAYTTVNANGQTVVLQGVFTPTGPQTVLPAPTTTGSVLGYTQWLSMIGTNTAPANAARRISMSVPTGWYYFVATTFAGLVGGAWLIVF